MESIPGAGAMERTYMSTREMARVGVLTRVKAGDLKLCEAVPLLGVSYRQAKRLYKRYKERGKKGLVHGNVGRRSNHAHSLVERERVIALVKAHYGGSSDGRGQRFGPTLLAEHLWLDHGLLYAVPTLTRWMREAGLWSRQRIPKVHYQRRERREHFGELIQLDGSFHDWFEGRYDRSGGRKRTRTESHTCLMTMIDDATGTLLGRFSEEETIWSAAHLLERWIELYGVPRALYVDAKNVYVRPPTNYELSRGVRACTQFGRMCAKLGIEVIVAKSPQAKGRVERVHGTNQDRLIKKMRLSKVSTLEDANRYLDESYLSAHNARFAVKPKSGVDYHLPRTTRYSADDIYCLEEWRRLGNDWVVRYHNQGLQIECKGAAKRYCAPGSRILIRETEAGVIRVIAQSHENSRFPREHLLEWKPVTVGKELPPVPIPMGHNTISKTINQGTAVISNSLSSVSRNSTLSQAQAEALDRGRQIQTRMMDKDLRRWMGLKAYNAKRAHEKALRTASNKETEKGTFLLT